jgi:hypothetical protein
LSAKWTVKVCCVIYLAEFSNIADTLALEGLEVSGNTTVLEIDNSGKRLVQERTERGNREVTGFGLLMFSIGLIETRLSTYSQSVDHGFKTHVDLAAANDLGHVGRVIGF